MFCVMHTSSKWFEESSADVMRTGSEDFIRLVWPCTSTGSSRCARWLLAIGMPFRCGRSALVSGEDPGWALRTCFSRTGTPGRSVLATTPASAGIQHASMDPGYQRYPYQSPAQLQYVESTVRNPLPL